MTPKTVERAHFILQIVALPSPIQCASAVLRLVIRCAAAIEIGGRHRHFKVSQLWRKTPNKDRKVRGCHDPAAGGVKDNAEVTGNCKKLSSRVGYNGS